MMRGGQVLGLNRTETIRVMSLIQTQEVTRVYQMGANLVTALDHVNVSLDEGEFVAIQGTSGSGKSTLLNLLGGLDRPTTGEVLFDSNPLGPLTKKQMARYRQMTGEERLLIALTLHELSCEIARDGIRGRYPNATPEAVEVKLHERLRHAYQSYVADVVAND